MLISSRVIGSFLEEEMFELSIKEQKGMSEETKRVEGFSGKKSSLHKRQGGNGQVIHLD